MRLLYLAAAVFCVAGAARGDSANLDGGVFIAHYSPNLTYTTDTPEGGWGVVLQSSPDSIQSCEDQNSRVDGPVDHAMWFIISAWDQSKDWCTTQVGIGTYDTNVWQFQDNGPLYPDGGSGLEIYTNDFPSPSSGVVFGPEGSFWSSNFEPVWWFEGYAYGPAYGTTMLALDVDPSTGFGGWFSCGNPPEEFGAASFGAMGVNGAGVAVCPDERGGGEDHGSEAAGSAVCCIDGECYIVTEEDCARLRGEFLSEWRACDPIQCLEAPRDVEGLYGVPTCLVRINDDGSYTVEGQHDALVAMMGEDHLKQGYVPVALGASRTLKVFDRTSRPGANVPVEIREDGIAFPRVLCIPGEHARFLLHSGMSSGIAVLDAAGNRVSSVRTHSGFSHDGVVCSEDGRYVLFLQEFDQAHSRLRHGQPVRSFIAPTDHLENQDAIPFFGGIAIGAHGEFYLLSHSVSDAAFVKSQQYGKLLLVQLDAFGSIISEVLISQQGTPIALASGGDVLYVAFWETEGDELSGPDQPVPYGQYARFAEPGRAWFATVEDGQVTRHEIPNRRGAIRLLRAANGEMALACGVTIVPVENGIPLWNAAWSLSELGHGLERLPSRGTSSRGNLDIQLLSPVQGWVLWGQGPDLLNHIPGQPKLLNPQLWFVTRAAAYPVEMDWLDPVEVGSLMDHDGAVIQHATSSTVVMSIADYGLVALEVRAARE